MRTDEHGRFVKTEPKRDPEFVRLVHMLPCCARELPGHVCSGPLEAHHAGPRENGASEKADDDTSIPMCKLSHQALHGAARMGKCIFFKTCGKDGLRAWEDRWIGITRKQVARLRSNPSSGPRSPAEVEW